MPEVKHKDKGVKGANDPEKENCGDCDGEYGTVNYRADCRKSVEQYNDECESGNFTEEDKVSSKSITLEEAEVIEVTLEKSGGLLGFSISGVQVNH